MAGGSCTNAINGLGTGAFLMDGNYERDVRIRTLQLERL